MGFGLINFEFKKWKSSIDWKLLILLLLFLNVKLVIKIPAIVFVYLLDPNLKFGFRLKNSRLPLFYPLIAGIAGLGFFFNQAYQNPAYLLVFFTGLVFWMLCLLAIHQVKRSIELQEPAIIHRTLCLFFVINALFSILNLTFIIGETGTINPYLYQGHYQKYFMGTGDYIKGITFDTSTTNAILNAIGVLYFLSKKNYLMLLTCMFVLLLTASNFVNIILLLILAMLFIFKSTRNQKSTIVICVLMLAVFMFRVSPQNNKYVSENFKQLFTKAKTRPGINPKTVMLPIAQRPDSALDLEERKEKTAILFLDSLNKIELLAESKKPAQQIPAHLLKDEEGRILLPKDDINSPSFQSIKVPLPAQQPIIRFITENSAFLPLSTQKERALKLPGKVISLSQSFNFLRQNPIKLILGNGMGNFSSKLAFRTTKLGIAGSYPGPRYIHSDFMQNHLDLYLLFFSQQSGYHSLTNNPFSVYDELLLEYGVIGLLAFLIYYVGYFVKHHRKLSYGIPILLLLLSIFFVDYWYEQLSVVIVFELILLLDIKESTLKMIERTEHE
ncbi:MAG: hypothetical protein V4541_08345 [Bacteroidota bacterium]